MNSNITLRQLRAFLAVTEHASFTKAAETLNITQSALTTAVKNLEDEIGLRLFDRTTRKVDPTVYGHRFSIIASRFVDDFESAIDDLRAHAERRQGQVVAGATATIISNVLVPALKLLASRHPGIRVRISEELTTGAVERVNNGDMDLAFTTISPADRDIDAIPVMRDAFALIYAPDHPLAETDGAHAWDVFRRYPTLGLPGESGIHKILSVHEHGQAAVRQVTYEVSSIAGLTSMVRDGLGIAAVPDLIAQEMQSEGVRVAPLTPTIYRTVSLVSRPGRTPTPAASAFVSATLSELQKLRRPGVDILVTISELTERGYAIE